MKIAQGKCELESYYSQATIVKTDLKKKLLFCIKNQQGEGLLQMDKKKCCL